MLYAENFGLWDCSRLLQIELQMVRILVVTRNWITTSRMLCGMRYTGHLVRISMYSSSPKYSNS